METDFWRRAKMNMSAKDEAKEGQINWRKWDEDSAQKRTYMYWKLMKSDLP